MPRRADGRAGGRSGERRQGRSGAGDLTPEEQARLRAECEERRRERERRRAAARGEQWVEPAPHPVQSPLSPTSRPAGRAPGADVGGPRPGPAGPAVPGPGDRRGPRVGPEGRAAVVAEGSRRRRWPVRVALLVLLFVVVLAAGFAVGYVRDLFDWGEVGGPVTVTIPKGATLSEIGRILEDAGVVRHAFAFVRKAEEDGHGGDLKSGTYDLRVNEPYESLIAALLSGEKVQTARVTIPEGFTLEQSSRRWAREIEGFDASAYRRIAAEDPPAVELDGYKTGTTLEGLLFPATYEVRLTLKPQRAVALQLDALFANLEKVDMSRARAANLTTYDVLIIASLVEREARVADERPLVAAVIWNRLREGMPLQIDATIQYALPEYKEQLTFDDLEIDSPYNTYKIAGLPPTPIANPGLAAIQAAADPAGVDYLYYVAKGDGSGEHYFSTTYKEFLQNKAKAAAGE